MKYPLLVLFVLLLSAPSFGADLTQKADEANRTIWNRFIDPHGIMYDYTGLDGEVVLPTPEECEQGKPNALGWWSPIENGGFFNGLYLVSQCMRCEKNDTPENRNKVERLVQGLYKLQDVGSTPGFIARGVGSDGRSHYAASSDDQCFPFIVGLWRYWKSPISSAEKRRECRERLIRHLEAIKANRWLIVGDKPNFVRADWMNTDYHCATHMIMSVRIMIELTDGAEWKALYKELLDGKTAAGRERRENIRSGPKDLANWSAWFYSGCQYAVRELYRSETDPELKSLYKESLRNSAFSATKLIGLYKKFDHDDPGFFTPDWRLMMPPYREQKNSDEANRLAMEQYKVWTKACPAIAKEKGTLKPSICAAWIVVLSEDKTLIDESLPEIKNAVEYFDYSRMHYAAFFFVENLVYTMTQNGEK